MTATITPSTTTAGASTSAVRSALATKPVWLVGAAATVAAAVVTMVIAAIAKAADVPLAVAASKDEAAEAIPTAGVVPVVLVAGAIGIVLALAINRWAKRPARTFVVVTVALTVVSFITPTSAFAYNATTATRLTLELLHVVAAAIIIPTIAYRLARR
jgi:uncharacterized protein DUF6069